MTRDESGKRISRGAYHRSRRKGCRYVRGERFEVPHIYPTSVRRSIRRQMERRVAERWDGLPKNGTRNR